MEKDTIYTEDLADFGMRERTISAALLAAKLPEGFNDDGVKLAMNRNSGYVFLVNADYQVAMMNGACLELFHSLPGGEEGFLTDLIDELSPDDLHHEDTDYIRNAAKAEGVDLPEAWLIAT